MYILPLEFVIPIVIGVSILGLGTIISAGVYHKGKKKSHSIKGAKTQKSSSSSSKPSSSSSSSSKQASVASRSSSISSSVSDHSSPKSDQYEDAKIDSKGGKNVTKRHH